MIGNIVYDNQKLKELFNIALDYLRDEIALDFLDPRFERAEFKVENFSWEIIISFLVENKFRTTYSNNNNGLKRPKYDRIYKRIRIDNNDEVLGFYIHNRKTY